MAKQVPRLVALAGVAALAHHWMVFSELALSIELVQEGSASGSQILAANRAAFDIVAAAVLWHSVPAFANGVIWTMRALLFAQTCIVQGVDLVRNGLTTRLVYALRWLIDRLQP